MKTMKKELTKEQIAEELSPGAPLSIRSVERYIQIANEGGAGIVPKVEGVGRGKKATYKRDDVEKIKAAYRAAQEAQKEREQGSTSLALHRPAATSLAIAEGMRESYLALASALDSCPVWLSRAEAIERTGLPASWLDAGIRSGELAHIGEGRGRRFHRQDVRAFAEKVREKDYLAGLLKG